MYRSLVHEMIAGNAIASLVHRLRLERNIIVLKLTNLYAEDSEDEESQEETDVPSSSGLTNSSKSRMVEVEVDLGMTAYANVSRMYGHKKVAQAKEIKTVQVNEEFHTILLSFLLPFCLQKDFFSSLCLSAEGLN